MTPPGRGAGAARSGGAPLDQRLLARSGAVRGLLAASVGFGLGLTACLVAQAVLLGDLLARLFHPPVRLGDVTAELVGLGAATVIRALLLVASSTLGARAANAVRAELRRDALEGLLEGGPARLVGERTGELTVTLGPGLDALDSYVGDYLPRLVLALAAPVVLLGVIGVLDWLSLVILVAVLAVVPIFMVLVGRLSAARVGRRLGALGALGAHFLDAVEGLPTLRAYGRARRQELQIAEVTEDLRRTTMAVLRETFLSALVLEVLAAIGTALVAVPLALRLIYGDVSLAPALTILVLTPEVFLPLRRASAEFHAAADGLAATDRVVGLIDGGSPSAGPAEGPGGPVGGRGALPARARRSEPPPRRGGEDAPGAPALRASGLSVSYEGHVDPVLQGCDLQVGPGERVALVGASGAGKSSLLGALVGLVAPRGGRISLGGLYQDEGDLVAWRAHFAYLPQRPQLFSGSLEANLRLGCGDSSSGERHEPDDALLYEVLRVAQLGELVAGLPEGLATPLGEHGSRLSTGERQRVALARALLRTSAEVVVLDEPTAHLDALSEARLVQALEQWLEGRSLVVASHRPRLLDLVDRVVGIEAGRIEPVPAGLLSGRLGSEITTTRASSGPG